MRPTRSVPIEALEDKPVHLVARSRSGDVAARTAPSRPDLLRSPIHSEPSVGSLLSSLPGASRITEAFSAFGPAVSAVPEGRLEDSALRFLDAVFELPDGAADDEPEPGPTIWRDSGRTVPLMLAAPQGESVSCADLGGLQVPTPVVRGEPSQAPHPVMAESLADRRSNAVPVTLAGVQPRWPLPRAREVSRR